MSLSVQLQEFLINNVMVKIIIIFMNHRILSVETILSTHTHARTHTHEPSCITTIQSYIYAQLKKQQTNENSSTERKIWQAYSFGKKKCFEVSLESIQSGFLTDRKGKSRQFQFKRVTQP